MLAVRRETMFVVWYRVASSRNMYEVGNVNLVLEISYSYLISYCFALVNLVNDLNEFLGSS